MTSAHPMLKKHFLLVFVLGFFLYLPSLFGNFVWDDEDFVYANKYVETCNVEKFFSDSVSAGRGKISNYYRPVQSTVYCLVHTAFGFNPFWFHLVNILVHIAAACAIFYFLVLLLAPSSPRVEAGSSLLAPFVISVIFLVHPIQTEAVSYVSGLSDPLFVLFGFLSLIFWHKEKKWYSLIFFILSILSKETGLIFLPLIILFQLSRINLTKVSDRIKLLHLFWPHVLVAGTYLVFHQVNINQMDMKGVWGNGPYANDILIRLATFAQNIPIYLGLLIFPRDLFMERDFTIPVATTFITSWLIGIVFANILIIFSLYKLFTNHYPLTANLWFFYLAFWISFVPYSGLVLINGIFYEHFLYLPLVFFFGFVLTLLTKHLGKRSIQLTVTIIILVFVTRNIVRQFEWNDNVRFYSQTLSHAPKSIRIINGLGMEYAARGDLNLAIKNYELGITVDGKIPNLFHNLANAYAAKGDIVSAERNYLEAIKVDPNFSFSYYSLLNLYLQTGQKEKTKKLLEIMISKFPEDQRLKPILSNSP